MALLAAAALIVASVTLINQSASATGGDNGSVKTHNVGTPTSDVNDEPKLACDGFYLDAFGFDGVEQVNWHVVSDTHGDTVLSGIISLDENGHGYTGTYNLDEGMYKLYWNFDGENGADKHKVFKIEGCEVPPTDATPATPTFTEVCGTANDTYTVPSTEGVVYKVNGEVKAAGTYPGSGTVTITAEAKEGYKLKDYSGPWSHTYTNVPCPSGDKDATPATPTFTESCGTANDTYTVPSTEGVVYKVNGEVKAAGTYPGSGTVTITAEAKEGYKLKDYSGPWSHTYTNVPCPQPPKDECKNIAGDQDQVPRGLVQTPEGDCIPVVVPPPHPRPPHNPPPAAPHETPAVAETGITTQSSTTPWVPIGGGAFVLMLLGASYALKPRNRGSKA